MSSVAFGPVATARSRAGGTATMVCCGAGAGWVTTTGGSAGCVTTVGGGAGWVTIVCAWAIEALASDMAAPSVMTTVFFMTETPLVVMRSQAPPAKLVPIRL